MKKGFTLIEIMVVVAVVGILAVVTVLAINPVELLRQGRDGARVSDMSTLNKAISLYYSDAMNSPSTMFMGTSSVMYVSIPDQQATSSAGNQCRGSISPPHQVGTRIIARHHLPITTLTARGGYPSILIHIPQERSFQNFPQIQ